MGKLLAPRNPHQEALNRERQTLTCEHEECNKTHLLMHAHSFVLGLNHYAREQGYSYNQCDNTQHFSCCHEHAVTLVKKCLYEHPPEMPAHRSTPYPHGETPCVICGALCVDDAYRYTLSYAMPGRDEDGNHYGCYTCTDEHWCCSVEHAQEAAEACLDEHLEYGPHG